jgi:N-acetylmuramoyl-L-alanine amidase-like
MKRAQPQGLNRRRAEQLIARSKNNGTVGGRINFLSRQFLGSSYKPNPLIGSADLAEVFTASFDGFDCVTYIETILALARASNVDDFVKWLRMIRYEDGSILWARRNHYMTNWIRNNTQNGFIRPISMPAFSIRSRERTLNAISGLTPQRIRINCIAKRTVLRISSAFRSGDLIFFVSTRRNLDVFHAGIIVRESESTHLRHASLSQGFIVEQELNEFLIANRMAGVMVMRAAGDLVEASN